MFELLKKEKETLRLVMAGHIDHGKSTLIGRLLWDTRSLPPDKIKELEKISKDFDKDTQLAYLTDQLKEERERNITIDTTEIFLKGKKKNFCLIDTPGHLEFIKNMLTGASQAEAAILIIDINEGVKDQTLRHAYLLKLLNISKVLVVLNKMDVTGYDKKLFHTVSVQITSYFQNLDIEVSHLIPVSAKDGTNVIKKSPLTPWYQGPGLLAAMESIDSHGEITSNDLCLPIQDTYDIDGEKIIVGRIAAGAITTGQDVYVHPPREKRTVTSIRVFNKNLTRASAQESIGFTLNEPVDIQRGKIIFSAESEVKPTNYFIGNIFWLSKTPLEKGQTVFMRCATQGFEAVIEQITQRIDPSRLQVVEENASELNVNEAGFIKFRLTSPGFLELFAKNPELGRYIIERHNALEGAGTVISKNE